MRTLRSVLQWLVVGSVSFFLGKTLGAKYLDPKELAQYSGAIGVVLVVNAGLIAALLRLADTSISQDIDRSRQDKLQRTLNQLHRGVVIRWVVTLLAAAVAYLGGKAVEPRLLHISIPTGVGLIGAGTVVGIWSAALSFKEFLLWRSQMQKINREIQDRKSRNEQLMRRFSSDRKP